MDKTRVDFSKDSLETIWIEVQPPYRLAKSQRKLLQGKWIRDLTIPTNDGISLQTISSVMKDKQE